MAGERGVALWLVAIGAVLTAVTLPSGDGASAGIAATGPGTGLGPPREVREPVDGVAAIPGFSPRTIPATAVVDGSLLVFGGSRPYGGGGPAGQMLDDGALVAPDGRSVRALPDAPFDAPLYAPQAVAAGKQVLVIGVGCAKAYDQDGADPDCRPGTTDAAVLDLRDGGATWRSVRLPAGVAGARQSGGRAIGTTASDDAVFLLAGSLWTFDPDRDRWREIPAPGLGPEDLRETCITGTTGVVVSKETIETGPAGAIEAPVVNAVDLGGDHEWTVSAPSDGTIRSVGGMEVTGIVQVVSCAGDVVVVSQPGQLELTRAYSLTDRRWSTPPIAPRGVMSYTTVWTGAELVFLPTTVDGRRVANAYRPATDRWRVLEGVPQEEFDGAWNGTAIVGYTTPHPGGRMGELSPSGAYRYVVPPPEPATR